MTLAASEPFKRGSYMFETPVSMGRSAQSSRSDRRARPDARSKDRASALAQYSGGLEIAWSHIREPLDFDDVVEWSVTGLDGQYPIQLGVLREGLTDRERGIPVGRKPFATTAVRDDQNVVEHRFCTVAPRASQVRLAARSVRSWRRWGFLRAGSVWPHTPAPPTPPGS